MSLAQFYSINLLSSFHVDNPVTSHNTSTHQVWQETVPFLSESAMKWWRGQTYASNEYQVGLREDKAPLGLTYRQAWLHFPREHIWKMDSIQRNRHSFVCLFLKRSQEIKILSRMGQLNRVENKIYRGPQNYKESLTLPRKWDITIKGSHA